MSSFYSINVSFVYNTCVAIIDVIAQNANYLKKEKLFFSYHWPCIMNYYLIKIKVYNLFNMVNHFKSQIYTVEEKSIDIS